MCGACFLAKCNLVQKLVSRISVRGVVIDFLYRMQVADLVVVEE